MKQAAAKNLDLQRAGGKPRLRGKGARQAAVASRSRLVWRLLAGLVLVGACSLRLLFLNLKPLHHDEGVNGSFMMYLFRNGYYHYDPANYHGPTLYYFGLVTTTLNALFYGRAGLSTVAIRLVPAVFGIAIVWLTLELRRYLGNFGAVAAAALLAVSPGMVYFSRYFIHEIPFVFLTLALAVTALRYWETRRPLYLMLASASAALLFATKETCIITFAVLILAWICTRLYLSIRKTTDSLPSSIMPILNPETGIDRFRMPGMAALLFLVVSVLFYSSFFTNGKGILDSLRTFQIWTHTGVQTDQYRAPWSTYFKWLSQEELPLLLLAGMGTLIALGRAHNRFAAFVAFWALGIAAAYSLVPYKTPWLVLNLILPMAIVAGYGLGEWRRQGTWYSISAVLVLVTALGFATHEAVDISFYRYDDDSIPYVYAHTRRQAVEMVDEIQRIAARSPWGKDIGIAIVSPEFWPLPWYFRDDPHAVFWGHIVDTAEPILIASSVQVEEVANRLGRLYRPYKAYELRPGTVLILYLRRDLQP